MNEEPPLENGNYEVALSCFSAAFALHASDEVVKGEAIRNHLGQGSLTTTIRYARIWNALQQGEAPNLSPVLQSAYEAAEAGHTTELGETLEEDPPEDLAELGLDLGKLITDKAWGFLQRVIQRETLLTLEEAEAREQAGFERAQVAEQEKDAAITTYQELEAECDRLQEENAILNETNQQLVGELKAAKSAIEDWKSQHNHTQESLYERKLELVRLKEQKSNLEEALTLEQQRVEQIEDLRHTKSKLEGRMISLEDQITREQKSVEKLELKNELLMQQLTKLAVKDQVLLSIEANQSNRSI